MLARNGKMFVIQKRRKMEIKLIPIEDRHKYRCTLCGETRSVKYFIPVHNPLECEGIYELPFCNKCAAILFISKK